MQQQPSSCKRVKPSWFGVDQYSVSGGDFRTVERLAVLGKGESYLLLLLGVLIEGVKRYPINFHGTMK